MKYILLISALSISTLTFAQKQKINEAQKAINAYGNTSDDRAGDKLKHMTQAIGAIDEASRNEQTKDQPKTWYLKARIYTASLAEESFRSEERLIDANKALSKALELDPKITNDKDYPVVAINLALSNFNTAIAEYNNQNFIVAKDYFGNVPKFIGDKPHTKYSAVFESIDTIRAEAQYYQAKAEINEENYTKGLALLEKLTGNQSLNQLNVLSDIILALDKSGNKEKQLEYITKAREQYPNDPNIEAFEINYYIDSKQYDELIVRLEEAMKKDPKNPKHPFNLGIVYSSKAAPVDGYIPENASQFEKKAEEYYKAALDLAGNDPAYNQSLGIHYYNMAVDANNRSRSLSSGTEKEQAFASQLLVVRNSYYKKALPILEKAAGLYEGKGKLTQEDKQYYYNSLEALKKIYATMNDVKNYKVVDEKISKFVNENK